MFAFGLPVTTVLRLAVIENFILGLFSTALGLAAGLVLLRLVIAFRVAETMPDIYVKPRISPATVALTVGLGVAFVALAPLLTWRKLNRMDVPGTLKVVE